MSRVDPEAIVAAADAAEKAASLLGKEDLTDIDVTALAAWFEMSRPENVKALAQLLIDERTKAAGLYKELRSMSGEVRG